MEFSIKVPKLEGDAEAVRRELSAFCREIVTELSYQRQLIEEILRKAEG